MQEDYYKILGVAKNADNQTIKAAYRNLARSFHPDINPGDYQAEEKFKEIGAAYEVLSDPELRAEYDDWSWHTKNARTGHGTRSTKSHSEFGSRIDLDDLYDDFYAGSSTTNDRAGRSDDRGRSRGQAGTAEAKSRTVSSEGSPSGTTQHIEVTLEEAFKGTTRLQRILLDGKCTECHGTGRSSVRKNGLQLNARCSTCQGTGKRYGEELVEVKIPAGIGDGSRIRLRGRGAISDDGVREDLLLTVRLQKHPVFERDGRDLITEVVVPYTVAALGGSAEVDTMTGRKIVRLPAGIQTGQKLRLAGQGLPASGSHAAGDQYARVRVVVPRELRPEERELLRRIAAIRKDTVEP